jgi:hypothetical protein
MRAALLAALLLTGCAGNVREELPAPELPQRAGVDPAVAARAEGVEFRAVGEGFVLDIFREERIRLTLTATGEQLVFPKPEPQYPRWYGSIYSTAHEGHTLRIEVRNDHPCRRVDRETYAIEVALRLDDREMEGCGREF